MRFPSRNAGALFLILVVLGAMMPATAAPLRLLQVRAAQLRSSAVAQSAQRSGEEPASLRLVVQAGNEQHVLMLRVNSHLGAWATAQQPAAVAFEGYLPGLTRSWVRVTRIGTRWTGVWFDGESYYGIDSARAVAATNADAAAAAPDSLVVFRLADVVSDGPVFAGDMVRPTFSGQELAQTVAAELQSPATAAALVATRRLSVGLIADAQLVTLDGPDVTTNMVARLDVVDGIFSSQLGVHMEAKSTTLLDATALSYTGTDPSQLLTSLRDYRGANTTQQAAGLSHLMTGRDMDGQTVGIAYLSDASKTPPSIALCSVRSSASLSEARRFVAYDALIMAHEMGHVFGAPHDGETDPAANQACAAEPTSFLMAGTISGSKTFSSCSLAQIAPVIEIAKSLPQCLTLIDADLSVAVTGDAASVLVGSDIGVTLTVRNLGNTDVSDAQLNITVPAGLTLGTVSATGINCAQSGTAVSCLPSALAINATASVRLTLHGATVGAAVVAAAISSSVSDSVASNNQSQVSISVSNVPVQPPNSGNSNSGGGAVGLELLGALLLLLISRKRWRRIA